MGYLTHVDGRCYKCKTHTDIFCDFCRKYICPQHRIDRDKRTVFCEKCEHEGKPPLHSKRTRGNPEFTDDFTASKGYEM